MKVLEQMKERWGAWRVCLDWLIFTVVLRARGVQLAGELQPIRAAQPVRNRMTRRHLHLVLAVAGLLLAQNSRAWHFSGVVWYDNDHNSIRGTNEAGVTNVTVQVRNCTNNALVATTKTASDGSFSFTDTVVPLNGNYTVFFTNLPAGYIFTHQIYPPPTNGTVVSTVNPLTGYAPCFVFNQLTNSTLNNAGICRATNTTASSLSPITVCPGDTATYSTIASGTGPFSYVWKKDGVVLAGKTTNSLTIFPVTATNAGVYSVIVSGFVNSVTNSATLGVNASTTASVLTNQADCAGDTAIFTTVASGTGPFSYAWRKDGALLAGQTTNTLIIAGLAATNAGVYSVEVSGACNTVTNSASLAVNTTDATAITNLVRNPGTSATFTTVTSGAGPFTYVWLKDGVLLGGQTTNSLTIPSVTSSNAGVYTVEVIGACRTITNSATLTVNTNVTATALTSQTVCPGGSVTFVTTASGTGPFSYMWLKDGTVLAGQISNTLTIPTVTSSNAGLYAVQVSGVCNTVTNTATLTVNTNVSITPLNSQTVCAGNSATFSTIASGTGPFNYVWLKDGTVLSGQTTNSLTIPWVTASNAGVYCVQVSGACTTVTNSATLTVNTNVSATRLSSLMVCPGNGATFSTIASGTGPFSYVWLKDGVVLSGQTTNSLTIPSATSSNAGLYCVRVSGACTTVTNTATLTVNTNVSATPLTSLMKVIGDSATFTTVASGTGPFSYLWLKDGGSLPGQTSNSITISPLTSNDAGIYSVEVSGACQTVTNSATLTVNAPTAASPLTSITQCPGGSATFNVTASGTGPFVYVWLKDGVVLGGQTTNCLSISSVAATNAGVYSVEVSGAVNTVTNSATLTVNLPVAATPFSSQTVCQGDTAFFTTSPTGTGPFSYVWRKEGALLTGQTTNSLTIVSADATNAGTYSVEITGACGTVTNSAVLTVNRLTTAAPLVSVKKNAGDSATFTTTPAGTGPFSFVWRKDGNLLGGQSTNCLTITSVNTNTAGNYSVEVSGSCNTVTNQAKLILNQPPTVTILSPTNGTFFFSPANITVLADAEDVDGTISKVEFFQGATKLGETTAPQPPYFIIWTNVPSGPYTLTAIATDDMGAKGTSAPVSITVIDKPPLTIIAALKYNPQTDFFEQKVRVTNPTYSDLNAVRVYVNNLTNVPPITVHNVSGYSTNGVPYVQTHGLIPPGSYVDLLIEYYSNLRIAPNPVLTCELVPVANPDATLLGAAQPIHRSLRLANQTFMLEFATVSNRVYTVQYSADLVHWNDSSPAVVGTGTWVQWIDNGQPKTVSLPLAVPERFYKVLLLP